MYQEAPFKSKLLTTMLSFLVCLLVASAAALNEYDQWNTFKIQFGKSYANHVEDMKRFSIFQDNLRKIEEHNARYDNGGVTYAMKITKFADMTQEEFKQFLSNSYRGAFNTQDPLRDNREYDEVDYDLPKQIDWRQKGAVTKVKDQGMCGSCWAFSAVGALEGQLFRKNGTLEELSPQDLVDCSGGVYGNAGCLGGLMDYAFDYVKDKGILSEKDYPYEGFSDLCKQKQDGFKIKKYVNITVASEKALAKAVAEIGPISCAMDANCLSSYSHGIIDSSCGCGSARSSLNHGVLVVGYGEENGMKYWLVKNSWGKAWGENGYFKLKKFDQNTCGIATDSSYPVA